MTKTQIVTTDLKDFFHEFALCDELKFSSDLNDILLPDPDFSKLGYISEVLVLKVISIIVSRDPLEERLAMAWCEKFRRFLELNVGNIKKTINRIWLNPVIGAKMLLLMLSVLSVRAWVCEDLLDLNVLLKFSKLKLFKLNDQYFQFYNQMLQRILARLGIVQ